MSSVGDDEANCNDEKDDEPFTPNENPGILSRMALNDNKAGMQGLDKEKINKIIHENSVGSKFYENERKKDAQVDARIGKLLEEVQRITPEQLDNALGQTNAILKELEQCRDLTKTIVHIDMDAFYASVEERDNPELKNKPMAVGGMGMLSTSNYVARRYGVRAAMPGFIGKKLCPELILVPLNFAKYREVSCQVREILASYDPDFVPIGLDEAYLDLTKHLQKRISIPEAGRTFTASNNDQSTLESKIIFGLSVQEAVKEMRFKIEQETKLTASAGIAPNTLLAKVASDMNKPNGQYFLEPTKESVMQFVNKLPIRKVSGIGKVTEKLLNSIGIRTCQDLYEHRAILYTVFSHTMSGYFLRICIGIGSTTLESDSERKSISTERTYRDISNPDEMYKRCEELCEALESDAKKADVKGLTVVLKIKTSAFELHTRSKTLLQPVQCKSEVYPIVSDLLKQELVAKNGCLTLRLIGVGLSKLSKGGGEGHQKSLEFYLQRTKSVPKQDTKVEPLNQDESIRNDDAAMKNEKPSDSGKLNFGKNYDNGLDYKNELPDRITPLEQGNTSKYSCPICFSEFHELSALTSHASKCASPGEQSSGTQKSAYLGLRLRENDDLLSKEVSCLTCPICNATFCCQDMTLNKFNAHVDSCLNRKTIMELVRSESKLYKSDSSSSQKTTKRNGPTSGPPTKKRKKSGAPLCTLDKFFK